ncbi:MAG TPA: nuclear transport factor 2 family protein [Candidatus Angelobacter sp.]|nr:nuclear transport factor 2 family protein [Candidatus Angelobacter sp.]
MKILAAVVLLILTSHLFAQGRNTPPGTPGEMKNDLLQIEREIGRANLDCDYKYFDRVEGEDFIFTDAAGTVSDKKQDMAGEKDCRKTDAKYDVDNSEVRLFGNTAVVTGRITIARKNKEEKLVTRRSRFTDVFVWRDGRWQLVAGHSSRIPDPAAQK